MNKISDFANRFATVAHGTQTRYDGTEYISHPRRVASLVRKYKSHSHELESLVAAAYLHDVLEDTDIKYYDIVENFGCLIASIVLELTSNPEMKDGVGNKALYLSYKCRHMTDWALVIKLCDRLDNITDTRGCTDEWRERYWGETIYIIKYLTEHRNLTATQLSIIKDIQSTLFNDYN